jgi:threonine dehydrogenase-like Zn-dependent dehydrogenase
MKAFVVDGEAALKEIPRPEPPLGEALVKVTAAGICKTDVEIVKGYMDFVGVPGHEFVGVVESSPVAEQIGTRVVGEINVGCGECGLCRRGLERHCPHRSVLGILGRDGAMAEYLTLPPANLVPVPGDMPDDIAVFTEPLSAALEILEQVHIRPVDRVLVIGDGKLGLLVGAVLLLTGCDLLMVGKHPDKLAIFERWGGRTTRLTDFESGTDTFDIVVEASGGPAGWDLAVRRLRPRGTLILKSTYAGGFDFNPAALVINEITVVGSRCGLFEPALRVVERGLVDPSALIARVFPFDRAEEAFAYSQDKGVLKVILKM